MGRLRARLTKLEEISAGRGILETSLQESGLPAYEWHRRRAWARATSAEVEERKQLEEVGDEAGYLALCERVLRREAPALADDIRARRDALWEELRRLRAEGEAQGRNRSTSYTDPAYWAVCTAEVNRRSMIRRGAEPIEDPEEARRIVERITDRATTTDEVLELVGWGG